MCFPVKAAAAASAEGACPLDDCSRLLSCSRFSLIDSGCLMSELFLSLFLSLSLSRFLASDGDPSLVAALADVHTQI